MTERRSDNNNFGIKKNDTSNRNDEDEDMLTLVHNIDEFLHKVQSNVPKDTQQYNNNNNNNNNNDTTNHQELLASCDSIRLTTEDNGVSGEINNNKKRESQMTYDYHSNKFQLSPQNNTTDNNDDDREKRGKAKRSHGSTSNNNDLSMESSSAEKETNKTTASSTKTDKAACSKNQKSLPNSDVPQSSSNTKNIAFPQVLHEMLQTAKENGYDDIISWQHHGRCFLVKDKKAFVSSIIPRYFNQTRYASFQRQLALYGFVRLTKKTSEDYGSYYHERFLRGYPNLACTIQRSGVKGTGPNKSLTESEPDFQTMVAVGIDGMVIDDDDISKQSSETKKVTTNSYRNYSSHAAEEQTSKGTFSEIDSAVYENQLEGEIKSAKQTPDHHNEDLSKIQDNLCGNGDDQNMLDDSDCDSTTIDEDEAIDSLSMAQFLTDMDV